MTGLSVLITLGANLARFGVIAPILMHAVFNTNGRSLQGLFTNVEPGSGGFLKPLAGILHVNIQMSFALLVALGGWLVASLVVIVTKGSLGYSRE